MFSTTLVVLTSLSSKKKTEKNQQLLVSLTVVCSKASYIQIINRLEVEIDIHKQSKAFIINASTTRMLFNKVKSRPISYVFNVYFRLLQQMSF